MKIHRQRVNPKKGRKIVTLDTIHADAVKGFSDAEKQNLSRSVFGQFASDGSKLFSFIAAGQCTEDLL